jgi:UDP-N-acetylglucosamine 2-epimerase (non-hydrolysing)
VINKYTLLTVVGTRPELIRLSRSIEKLDKNFNHIFVHTNQNYDFELKDIFFNDLRIRKPNYTIRHNNNNAFGIVGKIFVEVEKIINKENPHAFLVLGDTNSCLSAYVAKRYKIPIFHIEAGNRSFDTNVPEEINRKIIDHISDINIAYSSFAKQNLLNEGIPNQNIILLGSPLFEVINSHKKNLDVKKILKKYKVKKNSFFLMSFHREENLNNIKNFDGFIDIIYYLEEKFSTKVLISTHPRTLKIINKVKNKKNKNIHFLKPLSFRDYLALQLSAKLVISDSGSLPEESSMLNFPAIIIRDNFERQEVMQNSSILLCPPNLESFKKALHIELSNNFRKIKEIDDYKNEDFSDDLVRVIQSNISHINKYIWHKK